MQYHIGATMLLKVKNLYLATILSLTLLGCGTIYNPQILPDGRGIAKSEGQEQVAIKVIPLTFKEIKLANEDAYIRRVVDAGNLNRAARLISVDQAIDEKVPESSNPGPYRLGVGDKLTISQILSANSQYLTSSNNNVSTNERRIVQRQLSIADDGFASVLGVGRVQLAGLTQFEAEDLLYERLVLSQINPEFEIFISSFSSKKIYVTNNLLQNLNGQDAANTNLFEIEYTNFPIFLNQVLGRAKLLLPEGQDAQITLKRGNERFRLSARKIVEGTQRKIRLFPEDQIIIKPVPYRPETATIMGEVINPRLYKLSPSDRKTLSEALYSDATFMISSDTSQIYLLRPRKNKNVTAYHLDASDPTRLMLAGELELRPNDIIYLAPQPVTSYNRAFRQIFGAYAMTNNPELTLVRN